MYVVMIVATTLYLMKFRKYDSNQTDGKYHMNYYYLTLIYAYFFLLWGVVVTFLDQQLYSNMNAMVMNMIVISSFFYIRPKDSLVLFIFNSFVFLFLIHLFQENRETLIGHYFNGSVIFAFITMASIVSYSIYYRNYKNKMALEKAAYYDSLTGLLNRRGIEGFMQTLENENISNNDVLTIMLIDIDYFKEYNDYYGHICGDKVLIKIGELLNSISEQRQDCAIRFGGEELLLLSLNQENESLQWGELIREAVENLKIKHKASKVSPYITVSIGVVQDNFENLDWVYTQISKADKALYQAKSLGRNKVCSDVIDS